MRRAPLLCVLVVLGLAAFTASGCGSPARSKSVAASPVAGGSVSPGPAGDPGGDPLAGPSAGGPTAGAPTASGSPRVSPSKSGAGPSPGTPGAGRGPVTAAGPAGSIKDTGSSAVALTFDDGPDPVNTPPLLDLLKQYNVKATFCLVGFRARDYPAIVARIAAEGHTLCNHTWQHLQDFSGRDDSYLRWDLKSTNDAIHAAAPGAKISYFRAPYGNFNARLIAFAAELHLKPIHWDVDDECWLTNKYGVGPAMADHIKHQVQTFARPGSIILSHDNKKPWTATTYGTLVPWLKARFNLIALPT
jgi:peptidoglycan/xylan/chitin deacetylase (PgdA/CDA1 family)